MIDLVVDLFHLADAQHRAQEELERARRVLLDARRRQRLVAPAGQLLRGERRQQRRIAQRAHVAVRLKIADEEAMALPLDGDEVLEPLQARRVVRARARAAALPPRRRAPTAARRDRRAPRAPCARSARRRCGRRARAESDRARAGRSRRRAGPARRRSGERSAGAPSSLPRVHDRCAAVGRAERDPEGERRLVDGARRQRQRLGAERAVERDPVVVGEQRVFGRTHRQLAVDEPAGEQVLEAAPGEARRDRSARPPPRARRPARARAAANSSPSRRAKRAARQLGRAQARRARRRAADRPAPRRARASPPDRARSPASRRRTPSP